MSRHFCCCHRRARSIDAFGFAAIGENAANAAA
jgi:hypothetical protein